MVGNVWCQTCKDEKNVSYICTIFNDPGGFFTVFFSLASFWIKVKKEYSELDKVALKFLLFHQHISKILASL